MSFKARIIEGSQMIGLTRSVTESMLFRLTGMLLVFVLQLLVSRFLGPKGFGDYMFIDTLLNILLVVAMCGMDATVRRIVPSALAEKDAASAQGFIRFAYKTVTAVALICSVLLLVYLIFNSKKGRENFAEGMLWALILLPFLANSFMGSAVLRTFHRIKASMTPLSILFPLIMMAVCSYYYWMHQRMTVDAVLFIQLCTTLFIALVTRRSVRRKLKEKLPVIDPVYKPIPWLKKGTFHATGAVFDSLMRRSDILIVGYLSNHLMSGQYGVAVLITSLVAFGLSVTDYVYLPKLKAAHETGKRKVLQTAVHQASRQVLAMSTPLIVVLMLCGSWLLSCFGASFTAAFIPMLILLAGQIVEAAMGLSGNLLTMYGRHSIHHWICGVCLLIQVVLTFILVPYLGMIGAASASALARIGVNVLSYRAVHKLIGIRASVF